MEVQIHFPEQRRFFLLKEYQFGGEDQDQVS